MRVTFRVTIVLTIIALAYLAYTLSRGGKFSKKVTLNELVEFARVDFTSQDQQLFQELSQADSAKKELLLVLHREKIHTLLPHLIQQFILTTIVDSFGTFNLNYQDLHKITRYFKDNFSEPAPYQQLEWAKNLTVGQKIQKLEAIFRSERGDSLRRENQFGDAFKEYQKALRLYHKLMDLYGQANIHYRMGLAYSKASQYSKSILELEKSRKLAETLQEPDCEMQALIRLGEAEFELKNYERCRRSLLQAIAIAQRFGNRLEEANAKLRLGRVYQETGDLQKSLNQLKECLGIYNALNNVIKTAWTLSMIGYSYGNLGDFDRAIQAHEASLHIYRQHKLAEQEAAQMSNIGAVYEGLGEYERALDYFKQALEIFQKRGASLFLLSTHANLGETYGDLGRFDLALDHLNQALNLAKGPDFAAKRAGIYEIIGKTRIKQNKYELARAMIDSAFLFNKENVYLPGIILDHQYMGEIDLKRGRWFPARLHFEEALKLALRSGASIHTWKANYGKGVALKSLGDFARALNSFQAAIDTIEAGRQRIAFESAKLEYFAEKQDVYDEIILTYLVSLHDPFSAFNYLERAKARSFLDFLSGSIEIVRGEASAGINPLSLALISSGVSKTPGYQEVQKALRPEKRIIEYRVLPDRVAIWWLTPDTLQVFQVMVNREDLRSQVMEFRRVLGANNPDDFRRNFKDNPERLFQDFLKISKNLSRILIEPLWSLIQDQSGIYIIPDDFLHYLPFAALMQPESDSARFLIEALPIITAPSAAIFLHASMVESTLPVQTHPRMLVISDPLGDLAWARMSGKTISQFFENSQLLLGAQAVKSALNSSIQDGYTIVHFGTHCLIEEKSPFYSALILHSPSLKQTEIEFTDLRSALQAKIVNPEDHLFMHEVYKLRFKDTRLVVLSACETALGRYIRGEGLVGLSRAFMRAGVPTLMTTLWKVDDKATANMMIKFYQNIRSGEYSISQALRKAQIDEIARMHSDPLIRYPHPFLWAPFVITGSLQKF